MNNSQNGPQMPFSGGQMPSNNPQSNMDMKKFTSARRFTMAANIMGPVSLFFGGTLLSGIGLVCAILSYRKMRDLSISSGTMASYARAAIRASKVSIGVCAVAFVLNFVTMWMIYPEMMALVESGNLDALQSGGLGVSGTSNSKWG